MLPQHDDRFVPDLTAVRDIQAEVPQMSRQLLRQRQEPSIRDPEAVCEVQGERPQLTARGQTLSQQGEALVRNTAATFELHSQTLQSGWQILGQGLKDLVVHIRGPLEVQTEGRFSLQPPFNQVFQVSSCPRLPARLLLPPRGPRLGRVPGRSLVGPRLACAPGRATRAPMVQLRSRDGVPQNFPSGLHLEELLGGACQAIRVRMMFANQDEVCRANLCLRR
mmetsp:Transcript_18063/g.46866  ORF Transcript_18063/g.46866 Transcript_18063/m.46866 type:complete len:222 (+) Transcript_18063:286-951(+)